MLESEITLTHGALSISNVKIGSIYTSEKAIAYLYRYHIWRPSRLTSSFNMANNPPSKPTIGMMLKKAVNDTPTITPSPTSNNSSPVAVPSIDWSLPVTSWTDAHEKALMDALEVSVNAIGNTSFNKIKNWADGSVSLSQQSGMVYQLLGTFSKARDSFELDSSNI